jgi:hypothetical protein
MAIGAFGMLRPSKRERQVESLRMIAVRNGWRVTLEKEPRTQRFIPVYRYQIREKCDLVQWRWRQRYREDFFRVPTAAQEVIRREFFEDERFIEIKTFERGIELWWHEFGRGEDLEIRLNSLLNCLFASNNALSTQE